jgi:hypothetical protein
LRESATTLNPLIPPKQISEIFSNLEYISKVNLELLHRLIHRLDPSASLDPSSGAAATTGATTVGAWDPEKDALGDIFLSLAPFLKMYSEYVKNYNHAVSVVSEMSSRHPAFAQFLKVNYAYLF